MVRPTSITQEQVNALADSLRANAIKPTARALREQLGSGSMGTIVKMLQVWQANQPRTEEAAIILPISLQRTLIDFISQEIARAKTELQVDLLTYQQVNTDLIAESERQEKMIMALTEAEVLTVAEKAELSGRLNQMEIELIALKKEAADERATAERVRTELAKAQLRLEAMPRIEKDLVESRQLLQKENAARVVAEQRAAVLDAKLDAEIMAHKKMEADNTLLTQRLEDSVKKLGDTREALNQAQLTHAALSPSKTVPTDTKK